MDEQNPGLRTERSGARADDPNPRRRPRAGERIGAGASDDLRRGGGREAGRGPGVPQAIEEDRTQEIRAEITETRNELSETVNAIQDRLRPSNIAANAAESVKDAAMSRMREVGDSEPVAYARANPIPTIMVGIGIAGATWLAVAGREARSYYSRRAVPRRSERRTWGSSSGDYRLHSRDPYGAADTAASEDRDALSSYSDSEATDPNVWQERLGDDRWRHTAPPTRRGSAAFRATRTLRRTWESSPLLVGAASAVVGAIVGVSVPESDSEHRLMGETRDSMIDAVQETVRDKVNQVQEAATDAVSKVRDVAADAVGLSSTEPSGSETSEGRH